ncbi:MAG: DNA primase [Gammaproteobacteria bacterium]|nr:MAG: DNA primase [Pseudomonadota bacterium]PIE37928.1 MAG: DNA primase [Gammaproteobacteria bacterium]
MSGSIPQGFIDLLLDKTDLFSLINNRVPLKKRGSDYWACCPFHEEKSPSFSVSTRKNFYHCFGCGASGNAIDFLRHYENLSFTDSIESLAALAGMEIPRTAQQSQKIDSTRPLYSVLNKAKSFYTNQLSQHPASQTAKDYLNNRGLSSEVIERYQIGFAPPEKSAFSETCSPKEQALLAKLKMTSNKYDTPLDLFRNRIMFPIRNRRGKVVAFGGRTLGNDKAKYINSPESEVFHKSSEVFGLYEALKATRSLDNLLIVEGYMDVIALAQFGIHNSVATLGTATNADNITALLRQCATLTFCFDGDQAGQNAARKAMENALPLLDDGITIRFLILPEKEDPDSLIRKEGVERFRSRIDQARPLSSFFFDTYSQGLELNQPEGKGILKERALPQIERIRSRTFAAAIRQQLYELTKPSFFQGKNSRFQQNGGTLKTNRNNTYTTNNVHHLPNTNNYYKQQRESHFLIEPGSKICLALCFTPARKTEFSTRLKECGATGRLAGTTAFCQFLVDHHIETTEQLLATLATQSEYRKQFANLFDSMEHIPDAEVVQMEAEDEIQRLHAQSIEQEISRLLQAQRQQGTALDENHKQRLKELYQQKQNVRQNNE